jgi:membrane-bound serine protease (ClpP class)
MSDFELDDGLDSEMDERLRRLAQSSRTPSLPDETADLPWSVQLAPATRVPANLFARVGAALHLRTAVLGAGRLGLTLAVAGAFLLLIGHAKPAASDPADIVGVQPTASFQPGGATPGSPEVVVVPTSGVVDDVMADHIAGAVNRAEMDGAAAVVIQLDTLGGSLSAMQRITQSLDSKVPTIVWVGPSGASAASAGTFITLSANLAYMARSTSIGAASPVAANGQDIASAYGSTEAQKTMQFAIATISSLAERTHPEAVAWAVTTVQDAKAYTGQQALDAHGINGIATSIDDVLAQADGQTVTTTAGQVVVHTKGATIVTINEDVIQSVLHTLDDPNIAFILLVIGVGCVALELFHPTLVMGLIGAFALALSFYGSGSLPLNLLGVVLVVIGIVMFALEPNLPSHGLLAIGGLISFVVGASVFYGSPGPYLPTVSVAWPIIATMTVAAALYGLVLVRTLVTMRHIVVPVGSGMVGTAAIVGQTGEVQKDISPMGTVFVGGEAWTAMTPDGTAIERGGKVQVLRQEGLTLIVRKVE